MRDRQEVQDVFMKEKIGHSSSMDRERWSVAAAALFLVLVPWFCTFAYCLFKGQSFWNIYLPASPWNDELFYYKLTENVISYGYPQGYFGFNESHGLYLSFAAWSPVLLLFWVVWGLFFGWNLMSPILCNLTLLSVSILLFCLLAKPGKRQCLWIAILYAAFLPVTRFALSCIPEVELFGLFIVFLGLAMSCQRKYKGWMVGVMFGLVMLMTWMRPYLILLFLTPAVLWGCQKGKRAFVPTGMIAAVTVVAYGMISHFFSAPYLTDLFYTEWITVYFEQGFLAGVKYTVWKLGTSVISVAKMIWENLTVKSGLISAAGLYYFIFLLLFFLLLVKFIYFAGGRFESEKARRVAVCGHDSSLDRVTRSDWMKFLLEGQMLLCMAGFFGADLLMYRLQEGGRHTLVYIVGCIFLLPFADGISSKKTSEKSTALFARQAMASRAVPAVTAVVFLLLFTGRGDIPYEFSAPFGEAGHRADLEDMAKQLSENMELSESAPNYDNTVIWTAWDSVDGETKTVDFGAYYVVPKGFGINLCDGGYMDVNLESLRSRYIGVIPGGDFEKRCVAAGGKTVGECERLVIYDMRP